jgi:glycosyltransferase involved in cell wall biosynthesis
MQTNIIKPLFSVIIPTLNEEHHLPYLLSDLADQSLSNFEVIIVDAKSEDKTKQKALKFKKDFQKLTFLTSNKRNVSYQRNKGAEKAKSDWLIFLDADTRIPVYFFQGIKFKLELYQPDILSTWIEPDTGNRKDKATAFLVSLYMDFQKTTEKPTVLESFFCIKKIAFKKLNGFNENLRWGEGGDLLERSTKKKMKFTFVREPRYTFSFRRMRKQGSLAMLGKIAELELNRLVGSKVSQKRVKNLYPMEGGSYFELGPKEKGRVKKFFSKFINATRAQIKNGNHKIVGNIFRRIFG